MAEHKIGTKIAVLYESSSDYSKGIYETFMKKAAELGLDVVTEQAFTDQSKTDFSVQLQAIKNSGADVLFMPFSLSGSGARDHAGRKRPAWTLTYFGVDGMDGIIEQMGEANEGIDRGRPVSDPVCGELHEDEKIAFSFVKNYEAAYKMTPSQFAADAYDAIYTIKAAMEKAEIADVKDKELNAKLIDAMTKIEVDGVTGKMTWDANGEPTKSAQAVVIKDGAPREYRGLKKIAKTDNAVSLGAGRLPCSASVFGKIFGRRACPGKTRRIVWTFFPISSAD